MQDPSLVTRVGIIRENLIKNGVKIKPSARQIVSAAQRYFLDEMLRAKQPRGIKVYVPTARDWNRLGDKLSDFTDSAGAPTWNPISFAFKSAAAEAGKPVAEAIMTVNQGEAELNMLYVEKSRRGEGYGQEFVKEFEKMARALGAVSAIVKTPSWQGKGYYDEELGYEKAFQSRVHPDVNNQPQFNIWYHKDLTQT
jgi:GNAT superfamily N-acetyltransferase